MFLKRIFKGLFKGLWRFFTMPFRVIIRRGLKVYYNLRSKVNKNIRWELIVLFGVCLFLSFIFFTITNSYFARTRTYSTISYSNSIREMSNLVLNIGDELNRSSISMLNKEEIQNVIEDYGNNSNKLLVVDEGGKVLYKTGNAEETQLDLHAVIRNSMNFKNNYDAYNEYNSNMGEFITFYPVEFSDGRAYVILKGNPRGDIRTENYANERSFFALLLSVIFFIVVFYFIAGRKVSYIQEIALGVMYIAKGQLNFRIEEKGEDELANLAQNINFMSGELRSKIEKERAIEKAKSELITNVSHDLRTPLTSILGYLNLIKDNKYSSSEEMKEYINIAYNKSEKLKLLIEELFEYTKLTNEGIKLNLTDIALNELVEQLIEEFVPVFEENSINAMRSIASENVMVSADGDKLVRVFENLISNAIRYSRKPGEIKIVLEKIENYALFSISNKGDSIGKDDLNKIFDRFYRVEKSRAETTGGSGLGLAIAKSIISLHGGEIWAESEGGNITFYVKLFTK